MNQTCSAFAANVIVESATIRNWRSTLAWPNRVGKTQHPIFTDLMWSKSNILVRKVAFVESLVYVSCREHPKAAARGQIMAE